MICRTRHVDPPPSSVAARPRSACCALVLAARAARRRRRARALHHARRSPASQLEPRARDPAASRSAIVVVERAARAASRGDGDLADTIIADASAIIFFFMGYLSRQFRMGQARAEQLVEELEASREAQAQAVALRRARRTSRARCTTCSPTRSRRSPCSSRARGCWRARPAPTRASSTPSSAATTSPRAGSTRRGARSRRCAAATCRGPTGCAALADEFREQTGVDDRARARRRAARAALGGAAGRLPHRAGGAHQRAPPRRRPSGSTLRLRYADDGTWLTVEDRGRRGRSRRGRGRARLRADRDARARRAARRPARRGADGGRLPGRAVPARMTGDDPIRVLLADDQRVVREGLAMLLGLLPGIEVVGAAADGEEAVRAGGRARARRRADGPADAARRRRRGDPPARRRAPAGARDRAHHLRRRADRARARCAPAPAAT